MSRLEITVAAYLASSAVGAQIAIREDELVAFGGWNLAGDSVKDDFLRGAGTGFSAPLGMLASLAGAAMLARRPGRIGRSALWVVAMAGLCFVAGQAGEPVTWRTLRRPRTHVLRTAVVAGNIVIPAVMAASALRELQS